MGQPTVPKLRNPDNGSIGFRSIGLALEFAGDVVKVGGSSFRSDFGSFNEGLEDDLTRFCVNKLKDSAGCSSLAARFR